MDNHIASINYQTSKIDLVKKYTEYQKEKKSLVVYYGKALYIRNDLADFLKKSFKIDQVTSIYQLPITINRKYKSNNTIDSFNLLGIKATKEVLKHLKITDYDLNKQDVYITWNDSLRKMYYLDTEYYNDEIVSIQKYIPLDIIATDKKPSRRTVAKASGCRTKTIKLDS